MVLVEQSKLLSQLPEEQGRLFTEVWSYFEENWQQVGEKVDWLREKLLELAGFSSMREFLDEVVPQTTVIFFHAGSGTRWQSSIKDPQNERLVQEYNIDPQKPRGLVQVPNYLPGVGGEKIALACYDLFAVQRIAQKGQLVVVHGQEQQEAIRDEVLKPLGLDQKGIFVEQAIDPTIQKPAGHGDALRQALIDDQKAGEKIRESRYVVTCFAGPATTRRTVELSLLAMYVADKFGFNIAEILPTTFLEDGRYPIELNEQGIPIGSRHKKLDQDNSRTPGPNNVGIRVYRTEELISFIEAVNRVRTRSLTYQQIFGTDEFALDHIDRRFMKRKKTRIFNIARPEEIINDVKTIDAIPRFVEDMAEMLAEDFEPRPITPEEFLEHTKYLCRLIEEGDYNIVIIYPHPDKGKCGAGHAREAWAIEELLRRFGLEKRVIEISLENIGGILSDLYKLSQYSPQVYSFLNQILEKASSSKAEIIDRRLMRMDYSGKIKKILQEKGFIGKKTIFITTHVAGAVSAAKLFLEDGFDGQLIEYLVEPWPSHGLQTMSLPIFLGEQHWVVVHDAITKELYRRIRPNTSPSSVLPLGTPSPTNFRRREVKERKEGEPIHIGIEFSGNRVPLYDQKVLEIIKTMADDIKSGRIRLTIHTMWHRKTKKMIERTLESLGLKDNPNIKIIHTSRKEEDYAKKIIISRHNYIIGNDWSAPDIVITKGGEVPIEDRGDKTLVVVIHGKGHEERDTQFGVRERRAIDLRDLKSDEVYQRMLLELERRRENPPKPPPPSLAHFGLLAALDPDYFQREIIDKYFPWF